MVQVNSLISWTPFLLLIQHVNRVYKHVTEKQAVCQVRFIILFVESLYLAQFTGQVKDSDWFADCGVPHTHHIPHVMLLTFVVVVLDCVK